MWQFKAGVFCESDLPLRHLVTTAASGNMRDAAARQRFLDERGIGPVVTTRQVHGTKVAVVDSTHKGREIEGADGLVTGTPHLPLAIFTADCLSIFFAASNGVAAGVIHAGWRGLAGGIIGETVRIFERSFGVPAAALTAAIGPHIQKCCYSVGGDLKKTFGMDDGATHLDLDAEAVRQLRAAGVSGISSSLRCTAHETDLFFSYRRDKTDKRTMSLMELR